MEISDIDATVAEASPDETSVTDAGGELAGKVDDAGRSVELPHAARGSRPLDKGFA